MDDNIKDGSPQYFLKFPAHLVMAWKDKPLSQLILLYAIWRDNVPTKHADGKWHFSVPEIANALGKNDKTVRKNLKLLVDIGVLTLTGFAGNEYYIFSRERHEELISVKPQPPAPSTKRRTPSRNLEGHPLPKSGTSPLPKNGTLKKKEERREYQSKQSSAGKLDGTEHECRVEANTQVQTPGGLVGAKVSSSNNSTGPGRLLSFSKGTQAAPNGAPEDGTVQHTETGVQENSSGHAQASAEGGEVVPRGSSRPGKDSLPQRNGQHSAARSAVAFRPAFVPSRKRIPLPLPKGMSADVCLKRQAFIVKTLNDQHGHNFIREEQPAITFDFLGFRVCAYDPDQKVVLVTGNFEFIASEYIQRLCATVMPSGWKVIAWAEDDECLYAFVSREQSKTTPH